MKAGNKVSILLLCVLVSASQVAVAGQHGGGKKKAGDGQWMNEAEQSTRSRAEKEQGATRGQIDHERSRVEEEMRKRKRDEQSPAGATKSREMTRTTKEMHKEAGKGSDKASQERGTERKWWQFWK